MDKPKFPKVSIILLNYNGEKFLPKFFNSLKKTKYQNYEVIFVDNCSSSDKGIKIAKKMCKKLKIIKNEKNRGFAGGNNDGIKNASKDSSYVVILNADMYFHRNWLSHLIKTMQSDEKIGVACYARLFPNSETIETLGNKCINRNLARFKNIGGGGDIKDYQNKEIVEADYCLGMIRKSVLDEIGLFDEKNFVMYEEADLCRRIKDAGYKIVVNPNSKVWHFVSQAIKQDSEFRIYHAHKNRLRYVLKHNKGPGKIYYSEMLCLIYFYKALKYLFKGRADCSLAILKGIWWNLENLRDYF